MWWVIGILAVVVLFAVLVIRSRLKDMDDDYYFLLNPQNIASITMV